MKILKKSNPDTAVFCGIGIERVKTGSNKAPYRNWSFTMFLVTSLKANISWDWLYRPSVGITWAGDAFSYAIIRAEERRASKSTKERSVFIWLTALRNKSSPWAPLTSPNF